MISSSEIKRKNINITQEEIKFLFEWCSWIFDLTSESQDTTMVKFTDESSQVHGTMPYGPNTLTCQSTTMDNSPRDHLIGPVTTLWMLEHKKINNLQTKGIQLSKNLFKKYSINAGNIGM